MITYLNLLMMCKLFFAILLFITIEVVLVSVFYYFFHKKDDITPMSVFKGVLERVFLVIALANGFAQALTLFGALKLGTRLSDSNKNKNCNYPVPDTNTTSDAPAGENKEAHYNDYYLIGNLLSATAAIVFLYWYRKYLR